LVPLAIIVVQPSRPILAFRDDVDGAASSLQARDAELRAIAFRTGED